MMQQIPAMAAQSSNSSASAIERAANLHAWLFVAYLGVLVLAAVLTWLVWHSGNKLQDAIRVDSEASIAAARRDAALANEGLARSNEEIARLNEHTAALSLTIEEERRKRVEAEARLAELLKRLQPRRLGKDALLKGLQGKPTAVARAFFQRDDAESYDFAMDIYGDLLAAGWQVEIPEPVKPIPGAPNLPTAFIGATHTGAGIGLIARSIVGVVPPGDPSSPLKALDDAFRGAGFRGVSIVKDEWMPEKVVWIIVGPKPPPAEL